MSIATDAPTKIDLACGQSKREGFFGVDIASTDDADLVHDLSVFPWPIGDDTAEEVVSSHYVEHTYPVGGPHDGLIAFMDEVYRICADGAKVEIIHPYALSSRAFQDPTHTRFIPEATWWYFNAEWRESQKLDHYPIKSNFAVENIGSGFTPGWELRSHDAQMFATTHYWNIITDLAVTLKAIK